MLAALSRSPVQWAVASAVGLTLGVCLLVIPSLPRQWAPLAVLGLLFPFVLMMVGNVRWLLVAIIVFDISLQLDINLFYQPETEVLGALGGVNISVTTLCLAALYLLWIGELMVMKSGHPGLQLRAGLAPTLYLAFVALSVGVAGDVRLAGFELFLLLQMFLLYVYVASTVRTHREVLFIVTMLVLSLALQGVIILGTYVAQQEVVFAGVSTAVDASYTRENLRPGGTLRSPINAASFLALLLAPTLSIWLTGLTRGYKALATLGFALGGAALIATFSRGGWVTFAVSTALVILLAWRRNRTASKVLLTVALLSTLLILPFQAAVSDRIFGDDGGSATSRAPLVALALHIIEDNPVLGVGANNFSVVMMDYVTSEFSHAWLYVVHNKFLLTWAETGIGGLLAFVAFLFLIIRRGWQCWLARDPLLSPLALAFAAAILAQMIHMNVDVFHSRPQVQSLWFIAGLVTAMHALSCEANADHVV